LDLDDSEVEGMVKDLGRILEYMTELTEVDTKEVPAMDYSAVRAAPLREDLVAPGVDRDAALAQAPRQEDGGFRVPAFVDEG
jgi:aspartyl-tRNA(Asn)/glutamyl-tRNA(Gln) amidotransferase subunit C